MRFWRTLLTVITAIALALILILSPINILVRDLDFMEQGFSRYNVPVTTGLSMDQLSKVASDIIVYWDNDQPLLTTEVEKNGQRFPVFGGPTNKQTTHMRDVKALVRLSTGVWAGAIAVLLLVVAWCVLNRKRAGMKVLASGVLGGSLLLLALLAVLGFAATQDFEQFWTTFHLISFSNDEWMLDPRTDYLIMMFPEPFWYDAVLRIFFWAAGSAVVLGILSVIALRSMSRHEIQAVPSSHPLVR